jgi:YHS domain-containing protein
MNFLSRVLQFLFWLLVLSWGVKLLRRAVAWMLRGGTPAPPPEGVGEAASSPAAGTARRLVRDPVCGVHVAEVRAIPLREGTETLHFCSVKCRDEYERSLKKMAANG